MAVALSGLLNQIFALSGIVILILGFLLINTYIKVLAQNNYSTFKWRIIQVLIIFFIIGYSAHLYSLFTGIEIFIELTTLVTLIYFGGALFVIFTVYFIRTTIYSILGSPLSEKNAIDKFQSEFGQIDPDVLTKEFPLSCEVCDSNYSYSIIDIVRSNSQNIQKGIVVNSTFGVRNFVLRPTHKCVDGRREISVIHDKDLEFRSIDKSRLIVAGEF